MNTRSTAGRAARNPWTPLIYAALVLVSILMLLPLVWMISAGLKPLGETMAYPPRLLPIEWRLQNFSEAWAQANFTRVLWNSVFVAVGTTVLSVAINSAAGYAFAKYDFPGRNVLFYLTLGTLMIPFQVIMIPLFLLLRDFHMLNTYSGLIWPRVADAFGIFLLRQFLQSIPNELIEAARVDGAPEWVIFGRIVLPLAKPALAVLAIFTFMWRWNDLLWPLIAVSNPKMYTVQVALATFQREFYVEWHYLMALTTISVLPVLLLYVFFQRYFVQGISLSGLKG